MNRNFTRILVPTDFSAPSNAALALAKRMATTSGASLTMTIGRIRAVSWLLRG
jgi:nucleotide-binding universal stress UspA family protein